MVDCGLKSGVGFLNGSRCNLSDLRECAEQWKHWVEVISQDQVA